MRLLVVQYRAVRVLSPETIYPQTTQMDSTGCVYIYLYIYIPTCIKMYIATMKGGLRIGGRQREVGGAALRS